MVDVTQDLMKRCRREAAVAAVKCARYSRSGSDHAEGAPLGAASKEMALSLPDRARREAGKDPKSIVFSEREIREAARLLEHIIRDAPELVDVVMKPPRRPAGEGQSEDDRKFLLQLARQAVFDRQRRTKFFDRDMFGEPAWDVLLALYIADFVGGKQTIGHLAAIVDAPVSTVVRWIGQLERKHQVIRDPHPNDRRMVFVRLSETGRQTLDAYFSSLSG